jgi:hypothetical protein
MAQQAGIKIAPPQPQPQAQPGQPGQQQPGQQSKAPMGKQKTNPLSMTAPLKTEMSKNLAGKLQ